MTAVADTVTFLPEPAPRERHYTIISVDDHVVEPPDTFVGRVAASHADKAPRVVTREDGTEAWTYEDELLPNFSVHATVGRPIREAGLDPQRFSEMRRGCWDVHDRVRDMDINGIAASLNFPSKLAGFGGARFSRSKDQDLGFALFQAYNDWHLEGWAGAYPDRFIPCQVPWLADPEVGAKEIRRNAARGFHAVTFPDQPDRLGLPSLHSGHWDPILRACAETETAVCLHVGSGSHIIEPGPESPTDTRTVLFPVNALIAAVDWLYSLIPVRIPNLRIVLAEGGISWIPMILERLSFCVTQGHLDYWQGWQADIPPSEVLLRNFYFASLYDPSGFEMRHKIGVDHIMVESDYPHADSTWPDTQSVLRQQLTDLPPDEVAAITYGNAARLFKHPVPDGAGEPRWSA